MMSSENDTTLATRLVGGVWGHLVGDAVGVPYEFGPARPASDVRFGAQGTHGQPPGTWSDDGALMLALLDAMLEDEPGPKGTIVRRRFDLQAQGEAAVAWRTRGAYTPDGTVFDIGGTTHRALAAIADGTPAADAGPADDHDCGNGSLMRILPIALVDHDRGTAALADEAMAASRVTHGHPRAQVACALYVLLAARFLEGDRDRPAVLASATAALRDHLLGDTERTAALDHLLAWRKEPHAGRGRVWDSFWSAWDAFADADSYAEAIQRAVAYGHDTDTTAAIAGGLAGIYWTIDGIPPDWLAGMRGRAVAGPLVDRLLALHGWRTSTTNPLRVDWVELTAVPGLADAPGRLGMTLLPGKQRDLWSGPHWRDLEADVRALRERFGVDTFLLLVEDHEIEALGVGRIGDVMAAQGIELRRYPIPDMGVPDDLDATRALLGEIAARLRAGATVGVACKGGLGRTGTMVACLLRDGGLSAEDAIGLTRAARHGTIEGPSQIAYVRAWDRPPREARQ